MPKTISDPSNTTNQNIVREIRQRIEAIDISQPQWGMSHWAGRRFFRAAVLEILEDYERPRKTSE